MSPTKRSFISSRMSIMGELGSFDSCEEPFEADLRCLALEGDRETAKDLRSSGEIVNLDTEGMLKRFMLMVEKKVRMTRQFLDAMSHKLE